MPDIALLLLLLFAIGQSIALCVLTRLLYVKNRLINNLEQGIVVCYEASAEEFATSRSSGSKVQKKKPLLH